MVSQLRAKIASPSMRLLPGAVAVFSGPALAQQAGAQLEEIIVEATRLETTLDRAPAAVSVVNIDEIQLARQQLALDEALSRVPGLFMQNRYNFAQDLRLSIRGFGARAAFNVRGIKILVDGIPETLPDGQGAVDSVDIGSTGQVEVIRGPSSSIYGNASGGVVSVTSERGPEIPFISTRLSGGAYDFQKVQVKGGGRTERMDYMISLSDTSIDGYREHSESENTLLNATLNFDLGADANLLTVLNYTDQPVSNDPGGIDAVQAAAAPRTARDVNVAFNAGEDLSQSRIGLVYTLPIADNHEFSARSYYVQRDFFTLLPFANGGAVDLDREFFGGGLSYTYSGTLGGRPNNLIVGYDYDDVADDRQRFLNDFGVVGPLSFDQTESVSSQGIFVQNALSLSETIELTIGLRYDEVEFDVDDHYLADGDDSGTLTFDDVSPMLGIVAELTPDLTVYGTLSTAFETPTTTEFANPSGGGGFNPDLDPQEASNVEIGLRGSIGQRNRYEVALFSIDVEDELISYETAGREYFENAGQSDRRGVEFSIQGEPIDNFRYVLSYTYSDFTFDQFIDNDANDFAGNVIPGTPESLLFGEVSYNHPRGWFGALDVLYVDDQFANNANTAINPSYTVANLRLGFDATLGGFGVSPFIGINNLLDEVYNTNLRINAFGPPGLERYYEPAPDRNVYAGVELRYDFR